jgi:hypothetical protein
VTVINVPSEYGVAIERIFRFPEFIWYMPLRNVFNVKIRLRWYYSDIIADSQISPDPLLNSWPN